jgi:hypothetical protein
MLLFDTANALAKSDSDIFLEGPGLAHREAARPASRL